MVSSPSSISCPNMDGSSGVLATASAASTAARRPFPAMRDDGGGRHRDHPSKTWGSAIDQGWKPNSRADRACGTRKPASLSRVMVARGSNAPNASARQLTVMLWVAVE